MIIYKLRSESIFVKIDNETKIVTNVINTATQKLVSLLITTEDYYTKFTTDAEEWPDSTEAEFNAAKTEVIASLA
jgi:hypothetical protein